MIKVEIDCKTFPFGKKYDNKDVKLFLKKAHNNKCCYCETKLATDVEHFRPKSIYNWLIDDCENLLWACGACNSKKGNKLPVHSKIANAPDSVSVCNQKEELMMYNPAHSKSQEWQIEFKENGEIYSNNEIMQKTIDICQLNREDLVIARFSLFQQLENEIYTMKKYKDPLFRLQSSFVDSIVKDKEIEYVAFRKYIVKNFLADLLKRILK